MLGRIERRVEDFFNSRPLLRLVAATLTLPFFIVLYLGQSFLFMLGDFAERLSFLGRTYLWMWATVLFSKYQKRFYLT